MNYLKWIGGGMLVCALLAYVLYRVAFLPTTSDLPEQTVTNPAAITILAENLSVPWDVAVLPNGALLVTERTGDLLRLETDGSLQRVSVPQVAPVGEGGLMGMALHPNFAENRWLYLYRTVLTEGQRLNEVVRFTYQADHTLSDEVVIVGDIPGATYHDGGAVSFGPDGYLYITTGDAGDPALAQDLTSVAGKILRVTDIGAVAPDNPYPTAIYSLGHRNAQGLAWDKSGQLWSTEHGRSGAQSGFDELNRITAGGNYGWPESQGDTVLPGTIGPVVHSGARETWAPASLAASGNTLYFAGLRGQRLYQAHVTPDGTIDTLTAYFPEEYGRLRAARIFGDTLYLTTSNTDGRGQTQPGDDKLIALPLQLFP